MGGYPQRITSPDATLIAEVFEDPDSPAVLAPLICDAVNAYSQLRELVRDAAVVIERMANGASRAECSPELDRIISALSNDRNANG